MRALFVTQGYFPAIGGVERAVQRISEELVARHGCGVTVFTTNCYSGEGFLDPALPRMDAGGEQRNGVLVRRFPVRARISRLLRRPQWYAYRLRLPGNQHLRAWAQGPIVPGLARALRDAEADVFVAASFPLLHMFTTLRAARRRGLPCVLLGGLHPEDDWGFQRPMIYRAIREASHYVAFTHFEADYVVSRGADPERVTTVGLGVDPDPFMAVTPGEAKRRLGLADATPLVGFIGQLGLHKGINTLLKAMPLVWEALPSAHLLIAGAPTRYASRLATTVAALPPEQRRRITLRIGFDEADKPVLFAAVDVFASPSGFESFGLVFTEAWAAAKPVVACWNGAVPSVVEAGRDGLLVGYDRPKELAAALVALLTHRRWAASLGRAGQRKVLERYTWRHAAARIHALLARTVRDGR